MPKEKLYAVRQTELLSEDDWSYIIKVFEDITEVWIRDKSMSEPERVVQLVTGYDIQICEEIIRLRKQKREEGI